MSYKLIHEKETCIGCGACAAISPSDWEMSSDKANLIDGKKTGKFYEKTIAQVGSNKDAAEACPGQCIKIVQLK